jgi:hypothetical protein
MSSSVAAGRHDGPVLVVLAAGMAKRYGGCKPLAPVGLHGEAVLDLIVSDALSAGFGDIVLVLGPQSGPAISYHVEQCWPPGIDKHLAYQPAPLGTAHAALCAHRYVGDRPFAVINSDDVYGTAALGLLVDHLTVGSRRSALGAYHLRDTIVTDDPVTRGTCTVEDDGDLADLVERRKVSRHEADTFTADDGVEPHELSGDTPVSMNLWAFSSDIWSLLETAVQTVHPDVASDGTIAATGPASGSEVLLPEVVGARASAAEPAQRRLAVQVLEVPGRCIGVTHADDLPVVRAEIAGMVGRGERAEGLWGALR